MSCASSANLFAFICGPPWAWINGSAVLTELDIEHGLARVSREYRSDLGLRPHGRDRLPRKHKLTDVNRNALHPGDQDMIPAPGIEDQELSVAAKRACVNYPAVTRGCDLGAGPRCQRNAFFGATRAVGTAKFTYFDAVHGQSEQTLGGGECNRRAEAGRIFQPAQIRLAVNRGRSSLLAGGRSRSCRALEILLHFADQALEAVDLSRERKGTRAFHLHVLLDRAL